MRRVVLAGTPRIFRDSGLHVRVLIAPEGRAPVWSYAGMDGRTLWPGAEDALTLRVHTVTALPGPARLALATSRECPAGTSDLLRRAVEPWTGRRTSGSLSAHLTRERGLPRNRQLVAAYWRLGHQGVDIAA
ncbi:hypothetical protein ABLE91_13865 [Aquabacter sp. CN5-332]